MKNISFLIALSFFAITLNAQTILLDENFSDGIPSTWSVFDVDQLTPNSSVNFVTDGWVGYAGSIDTCAISTSYYTIDSTQVSLSMDYLVSPKVDLLAFGHILSWQSKSFDANYPESYYVLLSTTDSLPDSFTDTIKTVNNDSPNWKTFSTNLFIGGFQNQSVYIAFRNASNDAYLLGIDNVKLTTNDVATINDDPITNIDVFPNPAVNHIRIAVSNNTPYEIVSLAGEIVMHGMVENNMLDVSILKNGVYFIRVNQKGITSTRKIVKI